MSWRQQRTNHRRDSPERSRDDGAVARKHASSTGCGSCTNLCQSLLKAVAPDFSEDSKKVLCACVPFSQEQLRDIIKGQRFKSVQEILDIYGNGKGCHICKPALSYLIDVAWCGDHEEDRSARFINDRVHAN